MMRLIVTRPRPEAEALADTLSEAGHEALPAPMLEISLRPPADLPLDDIQALVATSRNALKALAASPLLGRILDLPIAVVGPGSARLAREIGFARIIEGPAAAADLVSVVTARLMPRSGAILVLHGNWMAFDISAALRAAGFIVRAQQIYHAEPSSRLPQDVVDAIRSDSVDAVILMSPSAATTFVELCEKAGLASVAQRIIYLCLSKSVAERVGDRAIVEIASRPNLEEMLALVTRVAAKLARRP